MQGSAYIFALQNKSNAFWQIDNTGGVTISNKPYFLEFSPDGWQGLAIQNVRNKRLWGIDRTVTIPLAYVQDAALILKHIFYTLGIEQSVYLVIAKQEIDYTPGVNYGFWYKQIYRGEVDLSTFIHNGSKVTCTTLEDGLPKFLKANEATVYELPMNVPEAVNVKMDGINLHNTVNFSIVPVYHGFGIGSSIIPIVKLNEEGDSYGFIFVDQSAEFNGATYPNPTGLSPSDNFFLRNDGTVPVNCIVSGNINYVIPYDTNPTVFYFETSSGIKYAKIEASNVGVSKSITFNFTILLQPNEKLFFLVQADAIIFNDDSLFNVKLITKRPTTFIRGLRPQYIFNQLINKVTEGNYSALITGYFATYSNIVFTCGNAIRSLDDAVMKISFADFFQFWDCFDSVGISEKSNTVNFDTKPNLVDESDIIDLAEPSDLKISVAKDYLFNELEIGYPEIKNEVGVLNGNEEFNCKYLFSTGTTKSPAKMDKVSKVKASCYEIELIRVTTLSKDTTDNKADNDLFVLHVENTLQNAIGIIPAHYQLNRVLNTTASGLIEPLTVFNLFLSPKRNLLRNGAFIRSSLYLSDGKILAYKSSDKNNKVVCNGIAEKADVSIGSLSDRFFYPLIADMDVPVPENLLDLLNLNPLKIFRFPFYGDYYYGLLIKASIEPASHKEQGYQLMLLPTSNLQKLISYYGG